MRSRIFILFLTAILFALEASAQCAMCKTVVETDGENSGVINGINDGILYLLAVPYVLLFIFFRKKIFSFFRELRGLWR